MEHHTLWDINILTIWGQLGKCVYPLTSLDVEPRQVCADWNSVWSTCFHKAHPGGLVFGFLFWFLYRVASAQTLAGVSQGWVHILWLFHSVRRVGQLLHAHLKLVWPYDLPWVAESMWK